MTTTVTVETNGGKAAQVVFVDPITTQPIHPDYVNYISPNSKQTFHIHDQTALIIKEVVQDE